MATGPALSRAPRSLDALGPYIHIHYRVWGFLVFWKTFILFYFILLVVDVSRAPPPICYTDTKFHPNPSIFVRVIVQRSSTNQVPVQPKGTRDFAHFLTRPRLCWYKSIFWVSSNFFKICLTYLAENKLLAQPIRCQQTLLIFMDFAQYLVRDTCNIHISPYIKFRQNLLKFVHIIAQKRNC